MQHLKCTSNISMPKINLYNVFYIDNIDILIDCHIYDLHFPDQFEVLSIINHFQCVHKFQLLVICKKYLFQCQVGKLCKIKIIRHNNL